MCTYYNICILIQQLLKAFSLLCVLSSKFFTQMDNWESQAKWSLSLFFSLSLRERGFVKLTGAWLPMFGLCLWQAVATKAPSWPASDSGKWVVLITQSLSDNDSGKRWLLQHRLAGDFSESSSSPVISLV